MISQCFTNIGVKVKNFPAPFTSFCTVSYVGSDCLTLIFILYIHRGDSLEPRLSLCSAAFNWTRASQRQQAEWCFCCAAVVPKLNWIII